METKINFESLLLNRLYDAAASGEKGSYVDVTAFTRSPSHFGGGRAEGRRICQQDTLYALTGFLERPAALPALRVRSLNGNTEAEKLFQVVSNGTFLARWSEEREGREVAFVISVGYVPHKEEEPLVDPDYQGPLLVAGGNGGRTIIHEGYIQALNIIGYSNAMSMLQPQFYASFSPDDRIALVHHVVHQFLRHHGHLLSTDSVYAGVHALLSAYLKKQHQLALDVAMIYLDILITKRVTDADKLYYALNTVGECLEALGRYEEAAQVYMEHEKLVASPESHPVLSARTWTNAGLAWKRSGDYEQAEQCYITALKAMKSQPNKAWNLNDEEVTHILTNFLMLYSTWARTSGEIHIANEDGQMENVFCALLYGARFAASQGGQSHDMVFSLGKQLHKTLLKPEYKKPKACQRVIAGAVETGTRTGFRAVILGTLHPNNFILTDAPKNNATESRRIDRKGAKEVLKNKVSVGSAATFMRCNNPDCDTTADQYSKTFKSCPCKAVVYCRKECQVEHWKVHKKICIWQAQRKATKDVSN